jgi:hypothetical protein
MNTSFTSTYVPLQFVLMYNMVAIVTGTPTGTVFLEASNDPIANVLPGSPSITAPQNWSMIKSSDFVLSSSGSTMWNVKGIAYNYVRVAYTDASGGTSTAQMTINFNGKGM